MIKEVYLTILFDYYGELLTEKQKIYFKSYYFDDLSLSEISENLKVSRNAISKEIKYIENKLIFFENKLNLYDKDLRLNKIICKIKDKDIKKELEDIKII